MILEIADFLDVDNITYLNRTSSYLEFIPPYKCILNLSKMNY